MCQDMWEECVFSLGCACVRFLMLSIGGERLRGSALTRLFVRPLKIYILIFKLDVTALPTTVRKPNPLSHCLVIHIPSTHWPISPAPSHLLSYHEPPLPYLHPSLTSHVPHTPPWCQLTPAHSHIAAPFDPLAACRSTQDLRPATASVLVCHRSLSGRSVIDGSWWAALTHRAAALGLVVWGSIDYDAVRDWGQSGLSGRRRGKTKDGGVMDEVLLVNVMRFDLCSIDHGRIFIWKWFISTRWANGVTVSHLIVAISRSPPLRCEMKNVIRIELVIAIIRLLMF